MKGMRSYTVRNRLLTFAGSHHGRTLEILSYDISGRDHSTAMAVYHFIFGSTKRVDGGAKTYRYPGMIEKAGVVWFGQSVFLLTQERSAKLRKFLDARGVAYGILRVMVS
jgi:hypothetical protein